MSVKLNFHCLEKLWFHASVIHMNRMSESWLWVEEGNLRHSLQVVLPKTKTRGKSILNCFLTRTKRIFIKFRFNGGVEVSRSAFFRSWNG